MSWEILTGLFSLSAAFVSVVTIAVKINRALVLLESAVERLDRHVLAQKELNERHDEALARLDRRVLLLESRINNERKEK